jgi:hypothetical protein
VKRILALVCAATALTFAASACGGGSDASAPTPAPTLVDNPKTGFLKPADKARDTVNQLNQQQNNEEQQTGNGSGY